MTEPRYIQLSKELIMLDAEELDSFVHNEYDRIYNEMQPQQKDCYPFTIISEVYKVDRKHDRYKDEHEYEPLTIL